jgi:hypothetical protein
VSALEAVRAVVEAGGEPDDVLREVVATLVGSAAASWAAILFAESGELVLGPEAGTPAETGRIQVPVVYAGTHVADLAAEGADLELLEGIAALIPEHCLVAWDTGGVPWEES